jgi:hypothetical protein
MATATPYYPGATIDPIVRIIVEHEAQPLPISDPKWSHCEYLQDIFGRTRLDEMPTIGITSGYTDYLDMVRPSDMCGSSLAKGIDPFGRHFVCMKIGSRMSKNDAYDESIFTIFRRYTNANTWVCVVSRGCSSESFRVNSGLSFHMYVNDEVKSKLRLFIESGETEDYPLSLEENGELCYFKLVHA